MSVSDLIARTRQLLAGEITPLPWVVDGTEGFEHHIRTGGTACAIPATGEPVADFVLPGDAALAAEGVSALPALLADNERLIAENKRLRAVLGGDDIDTFLAEANRDGARILDALYRHDDSLALTIAAKLRGPLAASVASETGDE